jgi:hypothetical protein
MTIRRRSMMSILMAMPLLVACDDKRAANAGHFEQALQHYYDGHPECAALPIDFALGTPVGIDGSWRGQADAMVRAGLLSAVPSKGELTASAVSAPVSVQYALTTAGVQAIRKGADSFLGGMTLCYAQRRITKVASFTVPAEVLGTTASRVSYGYELGDIAAWAKDSTLQDAFPSIKAALAAPNRSDTDGMVLTDKGWQDERALR